MVLESLVVSVLNKILGSYVTNLNYNQLNVGIWSGEVVLKNLQLKREALDKFNLPVDVLEGYLGELTLIIPWANLKSKPVKVFVNNVYLLAVPREDSTTTPEEEEEREQAAKQEKLAGVEMVQQKVAESTPSSRPVKSTSAEAQAEDDSKNQSFVSALVNKIIDNLQVSINNIHIRYEDALSNPAHPFAAGLTLSELSAVSSDENWEARFIEKESNTVHKLATLGSLAVYWNTDTESLRGLQLGDAIRRFTDLIATADKVPDIHQYVLKPVSGTGRIKLSKRFGSDIAKTDVTLLFDELGFVLDNDQYRDALGMVGLFHAYLRKRKYRHLHPPSDVTPKSNPLAYFRFAAEAVKYEIHDRNYRWSWEALRNRRDDRKAYLDVYVKERLGSASPAESARFKELERKLDFEDIRFYRSIAAPTLRREKAIQERKHAKKAKSQTGWLGSLWYGSSTTHEEVEVLTEEQRQELYDAIDYDEDDVVPQIDFPKDAMMVSLNTELKKGSFALKHDPHGLNQEIISLVFDAVTAKVIQYPDAAKITAALGGLTLLDSTTEGTLYKEIIHVREETPVHSPGASGRSEDGSITNPFFHVVFEHKPLDDRADNAVTMKMRHLEMVYNHNTVENVVEFFKPPEETMDSLEVLIDVANDAFQGLREQTRAGLEFALEHHKRLDLRIDMNAPIIVIPESCTTRNALVLVLDAGHINVESELVPISTIDEIRGKEKRSYTDEDWSRLQSLMYDKFTVRLSSTQLLIGQSVEACLNQIASPAAESDLHLINKINITLLAEVSILPKASNLTQFRVSGRLPLFSANFSDRKYRAIMKIVDMVVPKPDPDEQPKAMPVGVRRPSTAGLAWEPNRAMKERLGVGKSAELVVLPSNENEDGADETGRTVGQRQPSRKMTNDAISTFNQRLFEFNFRIDKFSGELRQADVDPNKPERLLANVVLEHFSMSFLLRPSDMTIKINLKSLNIQDSMEHGSEFKYLVTSKSVENIAEIDEGNDLVQLSYVRVDLNSPEYLTKYNGVDQTIDVQLSAVNLIITRSSILTLNNFILTTFSDGPQTAVTTVATTAVTTAETEENADDKTDVQPAPPKGQSPPSTISVKVRLTSITLILNNDGVHLATGNMSSADVSILVKPTTLRVEARLASFSLTDNLSKDGEDNPHAFRQLLTIQGDKVADFRYETFDATKEGYPGYDQELFFEVGSARLTFLEEPVRQLVDFASKFGEMYILYEKARQAAVQSAVQVQKSVTKLKFDIRVKSPNIVLPGSKNTKDTVVANPGELSISNKFTTDTKGVAADSYINHIEFLLSSMRVMSNFCLANGKQVLQILDDVNLRFDIDIADHVEGLDRPETNIKGSLSEVQGHLTQKQFEFLIDVANSVSRAFSGAGDEADVTSAHRDSVVRSVQSASTGVSKDNLQPIMDAINPPDVSQPASVWRKIDLVFSLKAIGLEIFRGDGAQKRSLAEISIAKFDLNNADLKMNMLNDSSIKAEFCIKSLTMSDTRSEPKSKFREIIPAVKHNDGYQFKIEADFSPPQPDRNVIIIVIFDSPKIIFSLDLIFALKDFFMAPFLAQPPAPAVEHRKSRPSSSSSVFGQPPSSKAPPPSSVSPGSPASQRKSLPASQAAQQPSGGFSLAVKVSVTNVEIILLANAAMANSEAIIVSAEQLQLSQQGIMALAADKIGMFLCRMDKREDTTVRFIETFDVILSMDSRTTKPGHQITNIMIEVLPLILRLSYRDAMLILGIVNKAVELNSNVPKDESSVPSETNVSKPGAALSTSGASGVIGEGASSLIPVSTNVESSSYVVMSRETMKATIQGIQVILIGDLHELPLIDATVDPINVIVSDWSSQLRVDTKISTRINFFNIKNSHWEPLLEPWSFNAKVTRNPLPEIMTVELSSPQKRLEVNITHIFVETALAFMAVFDKPEDLLSRARGSVAPYLLRNRTGYPMHIWSAADDSRNTILKELGNDKETPWQFDDWRSRREAIQDRRNMIGLQINGVMWESIRDIPVDREGTTVYVLRPKLKNVSHRLVVQVELKDNIKVVTFRSALVIENRTLLPIEVGLADGSGHVVLSTMKKIVPGDDYNVPIESSYQDRICVRPDAGFEYSWSHQTLFWRDFIQKTPIQSMTCRPDKGSSQPFHFQVAGRFDKTDPMTKQYPMMAIRLSAPIEIEISCRTISGLALSTRTSAKNTRPSCAKVARARCTSLRLGIYFS